MATTPRKSYDGFTEAERGAMKERAKELKATAEGDVAIREKVAEMGEAARVIAERVHQIVRGVAPELTPRLYYGMPAYAIDGKVVCFFQPAAKFKTRYPTFGFNDSAQLDDGDIWPTGFAVATMSAAVEERLTALVSRAVGR